MEGLSYVTKTFSLSEITESNDPEDGFLGTVELDVCTSHRDRYGDVLAKSFIDDATKSLTEVNTSFFLNHDTRDHPIGLVQAGVTFALDDGEFSTRIIVGIDETEEKIWKKLKAGTYSKASIGFYIEKVRYDEETNTLFILKGEVVEGSLVGVPANSKAGVIGVSKSIREQYVKSLGDDNLDLRNKLLNNKDREELNMAEEIDVEAIVQKALANYEANRKDEADKLAEADKLKSLNDALVTKDKELSEFEKQSKVYEEKVAKLEVEKKALAEEIGGRKTSASKGEPDKFKSFYLDDEKKALQKSLYEIGKLMQSKKSNEFEFHSSIPQDEFAIDDLVKDGVEV